MSGVPDKRSPSAAKFGAMGGRRRAAKLSADERRAIAMRAAETRWAKVKDPSRLPIIRSPGILKIADVDIEVYKLQDGRRLISKKAMAKALNLKSEGGNAFLRTVTRKGVRSAVSQELQKKIENPIVFKLMDSDSDSGPTADGYEAETLIEVCDALIQARNDGELAPSQAFLAIQSEIIIRACAKLGINFLVDGATGYINDKIHEEYKRLFAKFILDECRQYEKEFPDKFFDMIYRIYGIRRKSPELFKRPGFFAHFIRKYIYHPLANSNGAILDLLDEKNPVVYAGGGRKFKLFQFLEEEIGLPSLRAHLWQVVGIGAISRDKDHFDKNFYTAFPEARPKGFHEQLDLFDQLIENA